MEGDTWAQLDDAAEAIGRSASTVRRWIRLGHIASMPGPIPASGGRPISLVRMADVHAFASGSARASEDEPDDNDAKTAWELAHARAALKVAKIELEAANTEVARLRGELVAFRVDLARMAAEHAALEERVGFLAAREATEREGRERAIQHLVEALRADGRIDPERSDP